MDIIPILSTIILVATLGTLIVAITSYMVFRLKEKRKAQEAANQIIIGDENISLEAMAGPGINIDNEIAELKAISPDMEVALPPPPPTAQQQPQQAGIENINLNINVPPAQQTDTPPLPAQEIQMPATEQSPAPQPVQQALPPSQAAEQPANMPPPPSSSGTQQPIIAPPPPPPHTGTQPAMAQDESKNYAAPPSPEVPETAQPDPNLSIAQAQFLDSMKINLPPGSTVTNAPGSDPMGQSNPMKLRRFTVNPKKSSNQDDNASNDGEMWK